MTRERQKLGVLTAQSSWITILSSTRWEDMRGGRGHALHVPQGVLPRQRPRRRLLRDAEGGVLQRPRLVAGGVRRVPGAARRLHRMVRERQAQSVRRRRAQGVRHDSGAKETLGLYRVGGPGYCRTSTSNFDLKIQQYGFDCLLVAESIRLDPCRRVAFVGFASLRAGAAISPCSRACSGRSPRNRGL